MLDVFRRAVLHVPAYRALLRAYEIDPNAVRTLDDFRRLPLVTRENYLSAYPLLDRCRDGKLVGGADLVAVSSGSTGEPTFWPRSVADEVHVTARFEQVFRDGFFAHERKTLAVVCFPLGTWVGGMFTSACCRHLAARGYPIVVVTPGNQKPEILRVVRDLGPLFEQTVLLGYPPFLKDVVDEGRRTGLAWSALRPKLVLAGEVVSEEWRALVAERAGIAEPLLDVASLYGTADGGVLANETPVAAAIRRFLAARPEDARAVFGEARLPTLAQYDPCVRYFEVVDGTLLFTGDGGVPLVRYHISDVGGLHPFDELVGKVRALGFDPVKAARDAGAREIHELPFVHVFGRAHFAVSIYGANVFPEMVSVGLERASVRDSVTGKFVMQVVETSDGDSVLTIAVELAPGAPLLAGDEGRIATSIREALERLSSEYRSYVPEARRTPSVTLWPAGDPEYFPSGVKHRYSRR